MTRVKLLSLALSLTATLLGAVPAAATPEPGLDWGRCPDTVPDARVRCAHLAVPLDHRAPHGPTIDLAVSRLPAADPGRRRGVLVLAPGGPGGEGLALPARFAHLLPADVLAQYDLIGFDPRFVGRSSPASCGLTQAELPDLTPWPRAGGISATAAVAARIARSCAEHAGSVLAHASTATSARDLDAIRRALGEDRISYLGYSYATYLGAVYQSVFPGRTDRMVLDSAVDPAKVWRGVIRGWGEGTETVFADFAAWAAARDGQHHLGASVPAVRDTYFRLGERLDRDPVVLPDGNTLTGAVFREATRQALYAERSYARLAEVWSAVWAGRAPEATLGQLVPILASRHAPATPGWPEVPVDNFAAGFLGVTCGDAAWPREINSYAHDVALDGQRYPIAGAMASNVFACAAWPFSPAEPLIPIHPATGDTLVVNNLRDPATPLAGATRMAEALGKRGALVTADHSGHTGYLLAGNACVDAVVSGFLAAGTLPVNPTRCPAAATGRAAAAPPAP